MPPTVKTSKAGRICVSFKGQMIWLDHHEAVDLLVKLREATRIDAPREELEDTHGKRKADASTRAGVHP